MYGEFFHTRLHMKLYLIGNDKPLWRCTEPMMRRVAYFKFNNKFVKYPSRPRHRKIDDQLVSDLMGKDKDQVFTLLMKRASLLWKSRKLPHSDFVTNSYNKYISELDSTGEYISNILRPKPKAGHTAKVLHENYCKWCNRNGFRAEKKGDFMAKLLKKYKPREKKLHNNTVYDVEEKEDDDDELIDEENQSIDVNKLRKEIEQLKQLISEKDKEIEKLKVQQQQPEPEPSNDIDVDLNEMDIPTSAIISGGASAGHNLARKMFFSSDTMKIRIKKK